MFQNFLHVNIIEVLSKASVWGKIKLRAYVTS